MNRPVPIAYVITDLDRGGGAEKCLYELVTRLPRDRYAPKVFCLKGEGAVAQRLRAAGVPVRCLGWTALRAPYGMVQLARRFGESEAPLVHSFLFHANMAARIAGRLSGKRVICSIRVAERERPSHRFWDRLTSRLVHRYLCVSDSVRAFLAEGGIPGWKARTIPNGVDVPDALPPMPRHPLPVVVTIGRLHPQKGMDVFMEAALGLLRSRRDAIFRIAGEGPMEAGLKRLAQAHPGSFEFLGHVEDVPSLLDGADLFVLASRWEGMPNAVLEAMSRGRPVLATAVDGTPELVKDGVTGRLVPSEDPEALRAAMAEMLSDRDRLSAMGAAGYVVARERFTYGSMVRDHVEVYEEMLLDAPPIPVARPPKEGPGSGKDACSKSS